MLYNNYYIAQYPKKNLNNDFFFKQPPMHVTGNCVWLLVQICSLQIACDIAVPSQGLKIKALDYLQSPGGVHLARDKYVQSVRDRRLAFRLRSEQTCQTGSVTKKQ
jgi:hypothetical protein